MVKICGQSQWESSMLHTSSEMCLDCNSDSMLQYSKDCMAQVGGLGVALKQEGYDWFNSKHL